MKYSQFTVADKQRVVALFRQVFSDAEGEEEGQLIGQLVEDLISNTPAEDLCGFIAMDSHQLVGCVLFSRMIVSSGQSAFILSPLAVASSVQGKGIGQQLIRTGLAHLQAMAVELLFTYGDPAFYAKSGFKHISEEIVQAPYPLTQPIGWLGQSLTNQAIIAMQGRSHCVKALRDPQYW